jgi:hypothetical protein
MHRINNIMPNRRMTNSNEVKEILKQNTNNTSTIRTFQSMQNTPWMHNMNMATLWIF